ncbi:hypothetical protein Q5N85_20070, partial [Acinetobacter baumannii]|nr:hypothetical protein [Acinetobacter baumannii]
MTFTFDKSAPLRPHFWVDSISGFKPQTFSTSGMLNRGCIKILTQEFHPQELNHGPYLELNLHLDAPQM